MLKPQERQSIQKLFGVSEAQVDRDHAISHTLAALQQFETEFVFYGGTALSRTYLNAGRLSEDIDLFTIDRESLCLELDQLPNLLEQEFPLANWDFLPSQTRDPASSLLVCDSSIQIKVQVVDSVSRNWEKVPKELTEILQRYSDALPAKLFTPTFDGFVAMKISAWFDRRSPRDLFDLYGLSKEGEVTPVIRELVRELSGHQMTEKMLDRPPIGLWYEELAHQTNLQITAEESLQGVLDWWERSSSSRIA